MYYINIFMHLFIYLFLILWKMHIICMFGLNPYRCANEECASVWVCVRAHRAPAVSITEYKRSATDARPPLLKIPRESEELIIAGAASNRRSFTAFGHLNFPGDVHVTKPIAEKWNSLDLIGRWSVSLSSVSCTQVCLYKYCSISARSSCVERPGSSSGARCIFSV